MTNFERLLAWLGSDPEAAGKKYEELRRVLHNYFRRNDVVDPASLVDEVMERVTGKTSDFVPTYVGDPALYFFGVARNVLSEWRRQPVPAELPLNLVDPTDITSREHKELLLQSMEECWQKRSEEERSILYRYSIETSAIKISIIRGELARELEMSMSALRVMVFRLRQEIRRCIEKLMKKS
jgi:DNA-directed RNA polymerase specialized sigma24 family protein